MAYVGTPIDTRNQFQSLSSKQFNGDGSTTAFTLDIAPGSVNDIEVFVGNVRQDPHSAYTLSGTTLTFTGAPPSGTNNIYVVHQAKAVGTITPPDSSITSDKLSGNLVTPGTFDVNGQELILDADADTSITADTDDQIDIKIAGADDFQFTANTFTAQSGSTITTPTLGVVNAHDLGVGLHIKVSDTGASVSTGADALVIEDNGGDMGMSILSSTSGEGKIAFGDSGGNSQGQINYAHSNNSLRFYTNASEAMRIHSSGNVSIGTSTDNQRLFVYGSHVTDNGLVKVQTSNGSGNSDLLIFYDGNGTECGTISLDAGGNSVAYNTSSDYRLKENTENITDGITRLKQLKPYKFNWKSKPDGNKVDGFYAHEVSSVVPEAILGDKDAVDEEGNIKHQKIDQSKLVPLLTSALQEAITKIETLETEMTALKARVTTLEG